MEQATVGTETKAREAAVVAQDRLKPGMKTKSLPKKVRVKPRFFFVPF